MNNLDIATARFTDQGRRPLNEDFVEVYSFPSNDIGIIKLAIIADGMGGYNAGEIASRTAVGTIMEEISSQVPALRQEGELEGLIDSAVSKANGKIYQKSSSDPACRGMGTTIALALILHEAAFVANVGDSRIYLLHDHMIERISEDHTALADTMKSRDLTEDEIRTFPYMHALTRSLGNKDAAKVFIRKIDLITNSVLIMCSDGLTDVLTDEEILLQIEGTVDIQVAVDNLGKKAFHSGSSDNITVIGIEIGDFPRSEKRLPDEASISLVPVQQIAKENLSLSQIIIIALVILNALSIGWLYYSLEKKPLTCVIAKEIEAKSMLQITDIFKSLRSIFAQSPVSVQKNVKKDFIAGEDKTFEKQ